MSRATSPSMSSGYSRVPSGSTARPSTGVQRPTTGAQRPTTGQRPNTGQRPSTGSPGGRPSTGQRPSTGFPGAGVGQQPSRNDLNNFLNIPSNGEGAARPSAPSGANSAVADFLNSGPSAQHHPSTQPVPRDTVAGNRADNINNRTDARSDVRDTRGENRDFASDNRQDRVSDRGDRQSTRVAEVGDMRSSLADGRGERRTVRQEQLGEHADSLRNELHDHYDHDHLFDDFWSDHPHAHYHFHQNPAFWTWASVRTVQAFMPWNWGTAGAVPYDYGTGGSVYYEDETVYVNEEPIPAEEYAAQAEEIATTVPEVEAPEEMEWLPLGVFALTQDGGDAVPTMFLQLAISKEGIIAGTYQNKSTGQTESIEGMADPESQRAAWTIAGKSTPIMETGLANLTQNETKLLVHFADGQTQEWMMLHIENDETSVPQSP